MSPRRGQSKKKNQRRADAAREKLLSSVHGKYVPPPREDCWNQEAYIPWGDQGSVFVHSWIWRNNKGLADFALEARAYIYSSSDWKSVRLARIDICHGHAHIHVLHPEETNGTIHILRIDHQAEVQEAYRRSLSAIQEIADRIVDGREIS